MGLTAPWAALCLLWLGFPKVLPTVELKPKTAQAFDRYVETVEKERNSRKFLWLDTHPQEKSRVWLNEPVVVAHRATENGQPMEAPDGLVQDWIGSMFLPRTKLARVREVMADYPNYKVYFKPDVIESKLIGARGDHYDVFLRLYRKQVLTVAFNTKYSVDYSSPGPNRLEIISRSTHIGEVKDPKSRNYDEEQPQGREYGLLWRLNSYWRFEEADSGVYAELEAISLSRDVPFGMGRLLNNLLEKFPKESVASTMEELRKAVTPGAR